MNTILTAPMAQRGRSRRMTRRVFVMLVVGCFGLIGGVLTISVNSCLQ